MSKSKKTKQPVKKPKKSGGFSESSQQESLIDQPPRSKAYQAALDAVSKMKGNGKH